MGFYADILGTTRPLFKAQSLTASGTALVGGATFGKLGVRDGASGSAGPLANADDLVVEGSASHGISILTPSTNVGYLLFGDESSNISGRVMYTHSTDTLRLAAGITSAVDLNATAFTVGPPIIAAAGITSTLTGNADTATQLATPRAINGVNFDGTAPITITAAAGTLTGATLAAGVTASSLLTAGATLRVNGATYGTLGVQQNAVYGGAGPSTTRDDFVIENSGSAGISILTAAGTVGSIAFGSPTSNVAGQINYTHSLGAFTFFAGSTLALSISTAGVVTAAGNFSGPLTGNADTATAALGMPPLANTATATAAGKGKVYLNTAAITINNSVFAAGDVVWVYNNSAAAFAITQGTITTMRLSGTATVGTRTLAQRSLARLFFPTATECVVDGIGVT